MVVHLGIPMMNSKMHALCTRRILHGKKFKVSTNTRYTSCKKCCKRIGLDSSLAFTASRVKISRKAKLLNRSTYQQAHSLI